jgi:retinol-binding protein 3
VSQQLQRRQLWTALALAAVLLAPHSPAADPATANSSTNLDARARHEILQLLARKLDQRYVIPDTAKKLAQVVRSKDRSDAYRAINSAPELARALTHDLNAIAHDKHLRVNYLPGPTPNEETVGPGRRIPAELAETLRELNGMIPKVQVLEGNVGYIRVDGLAPLSISHDPITAAFAFVHQTAALIIDCRTNEGGEGETVAFIMSYLSEGPPYIVNTLDDRTGSAVQEFRTTDLEASSYGAHKPVFVLTSRMTFSAGEMLAYDLQAFKRAVVVGEVTAGGGNSPGGVSLGHHLFALIPETRILNPVTGSNWEGIGVKPDDAISAAAALTRAHQLAVERLLLADENPTRRALLEAVDANLQTLSDAQSGGPKLGDDELTGTYALVSGTPADGGAASGPTVIIAERGGELVQKIEGSGDAALVRVGGNRFAPRGLPDGDFTSFLVKNGVVHMVMEAPPGPPALRIKR